MAVPAIYIRVSSRGQKDGFSLETQEASCRAKLKELGFDLSQVVVYREIQSAATYRDRPQLSALREEIRQGHISIVACHAVDRLSRNTTHLHVLVDEMNDAGVPFAFATEEFDDTEEGKLIRSIQGYVAAVEREKIGERTMRGKVARIASGYPTVGGYPPYGYRWVDGQDADGKQRPKVRLEFDPETEDIVREIFAKLASGVSANKVKSSLNERGIPTPRGKGYWSVRGLLVIARNPVYVGKWIARKYSKEEGVAVVLDDVAPPYVSEATMKAIEGFLAKNKSLSTRNNRNPEDTLLRGGYARCGYCGGVMGAKFDSRAGWMYRCNPSTQDRRLCRGVSVLARRLDSQVWRRVSDALRNPDLLRAELERMRGENTVERDIQWLEREIANVERQQANLVKRLGMVDDDDMAAMVMMQIKSLNSQRAEMAVDLATLEDESTLWEDRMAHLDDLEAWSQTLDANLHDASYEVKRLALHAFDVKVIVYSRKDERESEILLNIDILEPHSGAR